MINNYSIDVNNYLSIPLGTLFLLFTNFEIKYVELISLSTNMN